VLNDLEVVSIVLLFLRSQMRQYGSTDIPMMQQGCPGLYPLLSGINTPPVSAVGYNKMHNVKVKSINALACPISAVIIMLSTLFEARTASTTQC